MTKRQKLELRASEIRKRLTELAGIEELTDEHRQEIDTLRTEYADVETKIQASTIADDEPERRAVGDGIDDGEGKELEKLRDKVELRHYVEAAVEKRAVAGAAAEFNQHLGIGAHRFPLEILAPMEDRATTDTDAGPTRPRRWLDRLFADTAASRVGVTMESVEPGIASYPMTTAGPSAAQRGRTEAIADAAWTIGVSELKPTRNGVRVVYSSEDALRNPGLEDALRRDMRMALTEGIDRAIFLGDAGANEDTGDIAGFTTASIAEVTLKQADKVLADKVLGAFVGLVDGVYAGSLADLRVVPAVGAYQLWASTMLVGAASSDSDGPESTHVSETSITGMLRANGLDIGMARGGIETATAAGDFGAFIGLGRGIEGAAVCPVWADAMMIVDPYTGAAKGETALTLSYHWNFAFVRAANFRRLKFVA
ncbi:MAG: phage major capsid protein [Chromatiales bacterium]|nr:phage major capsid protein [Chromatiales bacterium]